MIETTKQAVDEFFHGRSRLIVPEILQVINDLEMWHPLTVRQIYYQLVAKEIIGNEKKEYQNISRLLTRMREKCFVPWSIIIDRSRRMVEKRGVSSLEEHIRAMGEYLFDEYNRCLVQNQENYVEVWTEKDALSSIFEEATWQYCCRIVVCRGQLSATFLNEYALRAEAALKRGQNPVILYFGDLDPTGLRIPEIIETKLAERHGLDIELKRIALQPYHVEHYGLPSNPEATKKKDPNYQWYCDQGFGDYSVELDAVHPEKLIMMIEAALRTNLDTGDMVQQQGIQETERKKLKKLKLGFADLCHEQGLRI